ncbi:hypothetical protein JMJ77_0011185 [Colletotrichum scovillei]|uniref:Uncharacterized protein n=1 Tax=Colletotrichum scovillei TaxID=1209932 RepID=A0A9P7UB14_9PEZI|nr:hypothetical protein JMJ77_0011185 [Colletotrichum scovillei]KAG7060163.1 hypothetical protein JMJ78_0015439 [Colletotrichum scovillei]KAG7067613.1 hypothetical protein JMJ76_0009042 [Colletotrichum scovillei]
MALQKKTMPLGKPRRSAGLAWQIRPGFFAPSVSLFSLPNTSTNTVESEKEGPPTGSRL